MSSYYKKVKGASGSYKERFGKYWDVYIEAEEEYKPEEPPDMPASGAPGSGAPLNKTNLGIAKGVLNRKVKYHDKQKVQQGVT